MFGGHGIYCGERMFALIADDGLYLKTDDTNRPDFTAAGCQPFVYVMRGVGKAMSYFQPPSEALDSAELLLPWAKGALAAAERAAASPRRPRPKRKKP